MILCSTVRKLAAKQATIFKLTRHPLTYCGNDIAGSVEYFATRAKAQHAESEWIGDATITPEIADMAKHYMRT